MAGISGLLAMTVLVACTAAEARAPNEGVAGQTGAAGQRGIDPELVLECERLFDDPALGVATVEAGPTPALNDIVSIFAMRCVACHEAAGQGGFGLGRLCRIDFDAGACLVPDAGLSTEAEDIIMGMLLAPSSSAPDLRRVEPGRPDRSFLLMKVAGCQNALPEHTGCDYCGDPMPPFGSLREAAPEEFATFVRWIAAGAPRN
jgi:hypothetical protein